MFGFKYINFDAMTYVIQYKNGRIKKEGKGLSFFYFAPVTSIAAIPTGSTDADFIFTDVTKDFQEVSIQGKATFIIEKPKQLANLLDFTVDENGKYKSDDFEKLRERIINTVKGTTASFIRKLNLKEAVIRVDDLEEKVSEDLLNSETLNSLGIKVLQGNIFAVKANPEMARALEAKTREELQKEADKAIYERRNFAVEQERMIKQSELSTEIAVEQKKKEIAEKQMEREVAEAENERTIREMKVEADIAVEEKRKQLIDNQVQNEKKAADAKGYAIESTIKPYREMDWRILMALNNEDMDAQNNIALAFRELAENATKIENLNISPDLLSTLLKQQKVNK